MPTPAERPTAVLAAVYHPESHLFWRTFERSTRALSAYGINVTFVNLALAYASGSITRRNLSLFRNTDWGRYSVFIYEEATFITALLLFFRRRRPRLLYHDGSKPIEPRGIVGIQSRALRALSLLIARFGGYVTTLSPGNKDEIVGTYGFPSGKVGLWPASVDERVFSPERVRGSRERIRNSLGLGDEDFLVVYTGSFSRTRGVTESVLALKHLPSNIKALFVGGGVSYGEAKALVVREKLQGRAMLLQAVPYEKVAEYIVASDAGISPLTERFEGRSQPAIKVFEFVALNKPVIASEIPAHTWPLGDDEFVYYYKGDAPEAIAGAIMRAYERRGERCEHPARILGRFSTTGNARVVAQFISAIAGPSPMAEGTLA